MNYQNLYRKAKPRQLFLKVAIPGILSMMMSSLFQVIDGVFIGKLLGTDAFAATNLVWPFILISSSLADWIGVSSAVSISIKLGKGEEEEASSLFTAACMAIIAAGALMGAVLYFSAEGLIRMIGAEEALVSIGAQYLRVFALMSPGAIIVFAVDNFLRVCGQVKRSLWVNILMSLSAIVFEFLFVFVLKWGVRGAALSVCLSMLVSALVAFIPFVRGKLQLRFIRPKRRTGMLRDLFSGGVAEFLGTLATELFAIVISYFLLRLGGTEAVSTYGVIGNISGVVGALLYGLSDSLQPAVSYNYGAKDYKRIDAIEKAAYGACAALSIGCGALIMLFPGAIAGIFLTKESALVLEMARYAVPVFAMGYIVRWFSDVTQRYFTAVDESTLATIVSVSKTFLFPILFLLSLQGMFGLRGIWYFAPAAQLASALVTAGLLISYRKRLGLTIENERLRSHIANLKRQHEFILPLKTELEAGH